MSLRTKAFKHLGTLRGEGTLLSEAGREIGHVAYEIDGYVERGAKSANGQIEGQSVTLDRALEAKDATLVLDSGRCIHVVVSDRNAGAAEIRVAGGFPLYDAEG